MPLHELLPSSHIVVPLEATTVSQALRILLDRLASEEAIDNADAIAGLMAPGGGADLTAVGPAVALPHVRTSAVQGMVIALGIASAPLDASEFGVAATPTILALVIAPVDQAALYLQTVAVLARFFREEDVVARLLAARAPEDVLAIPELRGLSMKPRLAVRDVMTPEAKTILPDASARDALDLLIMKGFHAVPVVGETGEVLGVVTDRDLLRALLREPVDRPAGRFSGSPRQIKIRDIMSRTVLCVGVDMDVDEVANMMINKDIDLLPVVSEGTLAGVLTRGDIIRKLYGR